MANVEEEERDEPTIYVVDDDASILEWITAVIESIQMRVKAFSSGQELLDAIDPKGCGCVVTDLRMPRMSGLELQERLNAMDSVCPVIVISAHGEVSAAVRAMKAGAIDFLEKPFGAQELIDRINRAVGISEARIRASRSSSEIRHRFDKLTEREIEILRGIVDGKANKVMAIDLGISEKTVEDRRARVMRKMEAGSVAELTRMVVEARVFPAEA